MSIQTENAAGRTTYQPAFKSARPAAIKKQPISWKSIQPWVVPVLLLAIWQFGATAGWIPARVLPAPTVVFHAGAELWRSGDLLRNIEISSGRALTGLLIGGSIGFLLGLINGVWALAEGLLDSPVQMFRTIPSLALIPLVILWLGIGEEAKVTLVALGVFFPLYLNTYHGIKTVDVNLKEMGRVYGLGPWALFRRIIFPGALPSIIVGLRFALGTMWLVLIGAEGLAADSGIGFMTNTAREFMRTDIVLLGTVIYALLGKIADLFAKVLERRFLQWHPNYGTAHSS